MVERADQLHVRRAQHAVAEHVARHVADPDHGELGGVGVDAHRAEVRAHRDPRAARRDAHLLVVVARRAPRRERVAEPEAVLRREVVGDVGERRRFPCRPRRRGRDRRRRGARRPSGGTTAPSTRLSVTSSSPRTKRGSRRAPRRGARRIGRRSLDHEAALRADGHDHRVLLGLRLHEPEDLGAEVVAPVGPPDASTRDVAAAQVHGFDARRVHPDLVCRPRRGEERRAGRVELDRETRRRSVGTRSCAPRPGRPRASARRMRSSSRLSTASISRRELAVDRPLACARGPSPRSTDRSAPRRARRSSAPARGFAASASANDASVNRTPAWCRYFTSAAEHDDLSRPSSPARSTSRFSPSFSISPAHTPRNSSATRACASGVVRARRRRRAARRTSRSSSARAPGGVIAYGRSSTT